MKCEVKSSKCDQSAGAIHPSPFSLRTSSEGYLLVEVLVYIGVLFVILAVGYAAMYRAAASSAALRSNAKDIADAMHAGERWRDDVRGARGQVRLQTTPEGPVMQLRRPKEEVAYLFSTNAVYRRVGTGGWSTVLENVAASSVTTDRRRQVTAWRWELELQIRKKKLSNVRPLFTFVAVPAGNSSP